MDIDELENIAKATDYHARGEGEKRGSKIGKGFMSRSKPSLKNRQSAKRHINKITLAGGEVKLK